MFGASAVLALGAAAVLLLVVVRPRLSGADRASFPYWARLDEDEIRACMDGDTRAARIRALSTLAVRKFTHLRRAVDLSLAALVLLALAALDSPSDGGRNPHTPGPRTRLGRDRFAGPPTDRGRPSRRRRRPGEARRDPARAHRGHGPARRVHGGRRAAAHRRRAPCRAGRARP
ncbi:Pycsar system effector family protein [Streptomyces sp. NPDC038707]|uniref:Pycsar system effector family protein n=1 Tax=Streptomyces sp. NPDC038707 TaxID=3154329 RepID=UPI0033C93AE7